MLRLVLLAACSPNVVAFKTRFDKQADDSTGPTSRSLMFATVPQENDGCGGGERLVRHHDDYSCSCESPQDACMQDNDCDADQSCSEEGGSEGPQKMTYSSGSGAASSHLDFVNVNPGASKARCTNKEIDSGDGKADLAACKARCAADATCAFIVHWSDNGCQRFTSCTQGTHTWGADSTVYQVRLPCVQPLWSSSPVPGASVKIKADVECKSSDEWLGSFSSLEKCAAACAAKDGCEYFIYGKASGPKGNKAGRCYWEKTSDSSCSSGSWEADSYDFYGFKSASGWSRMEGGGQGGTGSPYPDGGYTYHYGTAQPCTSGHFWNNDDGRTCNSVESSTCPCQYGVCPAGYTMHQANAPSGWVEGELPGSPHDSGISSRRRYPYPKGHYYPSACPCMPTTSLTVYKRGYENPCPSSHPFLEKWHTSDAYWCYERAGNGGPCKMSNSGIAPPLDGTWGTNRVDCTLTKCPKDHYLSGGVCIAYQNPCPSSHPFLEKYHTSDSYWCYERAGNGGPCKMSKSGIAPPPDGTWGTNQVDCTLTKCPANHHVSGGKCAACPAGSINAGGDRIADGDSSCTCPAYYHVSGGTCVACPAGSINGLDRALDRAASCADTDNGVSDNDGYSCSTYTRADCGGHDTATFKSGEMCCVCDGGDKPKVGGDRIADGDSSCTCLVDYHVSGGTCVACPAGSWNSGGDWIADGDSSCTCLPDYHVSGGECVACPTGSISAAGTKIADGDSICMSCPADHHVSGGKCVACPDLCYHTLNLCKSGDDFPWACDILGSDCSDCGAAELEARLKGLDAAYRKSPGSRPRSNDLDQAPPMSPPPPAGPNYCGCDETCYYASCDASCDHYNDACQRGCSRRRRNDYLGCDHGCRLSCTTGCDDICDDTA
jgi:hypothetical protein